MEAGEIGRQGRLSTIRPCPGDVPHRPQPDAIGLVRQTLKLRRSEIDFAAKGQGVIICLMKRYSKFLRAKEKSGFVLGRRTAEKISAVEGMSLSSRMRKILDEAPERELSGDERRLLIKAQALKR
jgi:hypothetical protein